MEEITARAGQTVTHEVGDRKLVIKPLPIGVIRRLVDERLKPAQQAFLEASTDTDVFAKVENVIREHGIPYFQAFFGADFTWEWASENLAFPQFMRMLHESFAVNALPNFFPVGAGTPATAPTPETASQRT